MTDKRSIILEQLQIIAIKAIEEEDLFNDPQVTIAFPETMRNLVIQLFDYVWTEELEKDWVEFKAPATWWDHVKRDLIPWFGLKVNMHKETYYWRRLGVFPNFRQSPKAGQYIIKEKLNIGKPIDDSKEM